MFLKSSRKGISLWEYNHDVYDGLSRTVFYFDLLNFPVPFIDRPTHTEIVHHLTRYALLTESSRFVVV